MGRNIKIIFLFVTVIFNFSPMGFCESYEPSSFQSLLTVVDLLDKDRTCVTPSQQGMAIQSLKWFELYKRENINGVMNLFADHFRVYHSALLRFIVLNPDAAPYLRWGMGPVNEVNYRGVLAQLVNGEDQNQPGDSPWKLTCGSNDVVVNVYFRGYKVTRDAKTGCITHRVPYGLSTITKTFVFDSNGKIIINYIDFDGNVADIARAKLQQIANKPPIPAVPSTCRTAAQTDAQYGVSPSIGPSP